MNCSSLPHELNNDSATSRILDPNFFHPRSASNNLSILTPKMGFWTLGNMIRVVHPGSRSCFYSSRILDPDPVFYPSRIPDSEVKTAPDPRSATLYTQLNVSYSDDNPTPFVGINWLFLSGASCPIYWVIYINVPLFRQHYCSYQEHSSRLNDGPAVFLLQQRLQSVAALSRTGL